VHLYEAHLPVADTDAACTFYTDVVGLYFAHRDLTRDIVFLWATEKEQGMIGLWGPGTERGPAGDQSKHHIAFAMPLEALFDAIQRLSGKEIQTFGFGGNTTSEPTVIGWMPSAQIYFRDLDGHMLEFISILPGEPRPGFIGTYSEWESLAGSGDSH
jgi:lactoylglutathione lyase